MDRGAWRAIVRGVCKELDRTERLKASRVKHRGGLASVYVAPGGHGAVCVREHAVV